MDTRREVRCRHTQHFSPRPPSSSAHGRLFLEHTAAGPPAGPDGKSACRAGKAVSPPPAVSRYKAVWLAQRASLGILHVDGRDFPDTAR